MKLPPNPLALPANADLSPKVEVKDPRADEVRVVGRGAFDMEGPGDSGRGGSSKPLINEAKPTL